MTLQEIKANVKQGNKVYWSNTSYEVTVDTRGQWVISSNGGHHIGLTWADGVTLNGKEQDFFVSTVGPKI